MKRQLGYQEMQLLAYAQLRKVPTVQTGDLMTPLHLTRMQERELFRRMSRGSLIARVRRGKYLVPPRLPLGGSWSPGEFLALNALMEDRQGRYQICGPNAFCRYGFDDQMPVRLYAYNNRISGERTIGAVALTLIKVGDDRLGDTETVDSTDGETGVYSSRVRTLVDAVYDWSRFNSLPQAYEWIRNELAAGRIDVESLVKTTVRYGNTGTIRRIGMVLDKERVDEFWLLELEKSLTPSTSPIPWIPTRPKTGRINKRWGVVLNGE